MKPTVFATFAVLNSIVWSASTCKPSPIPIPLEWQGVHKQPFVKVNVGDHDLWLNLDTGSTDTYVYETDACSATACPEGGDGYKGYDGEGFIPYEGFEGTITYEDGSYTTLQTGQGPMKLNNRMFNVNFSMASDEHTTPKFGAGFNKNSLTTQKFKTPYTGVISGLKKQGIIKHNAYSIAGDEFVIGGYNKNTLTSAYKTVPFVNRSSEDKVPWHVDVALKSAKIVGNNNDHDALVWFEEDGDDTRFLSMDSGATFFIPEQQYNKLFEYLDATSDENDTMIVDCNNPKLKDVVSFNVGGETLTVPLNTYKVEEEGQCWMGVYIHDRLIVLGSAGLKEYSTVYNLDTLEFSFSKLNQDHKNKKPNYTMI